MRAGSSRRRDGCCATIPPLFKKALRATRESPYGVEVQAFEEDDAESAWILEDIVRDRRESGLPWGEFGVLYRTHEVGSRIEGMLLQAGVPCRLAAGRALQDDPVVQYLVAALRVISAPGDPVPEESFARVVLPETLYQRIRTEAETAPRRVPRVAAALHRAARARRRIRRSRSSGASSLRSTTCTRWGESTPPSTGWSMNCWPSGWASTARCSRSDTRS